MGRGRVGRGRGKRACTHSIVLRIPPPQTAACNLSHFIQWAHTGNLFISTQRTAGIKARYWKRFCHETLALDSKPTFIERIFTEINKMYVLVRAKLQRHQNKSKRLAIVNVHKDRPQFIHARSSVDFSQSQIRFVQCGIRFFSATALFHERTHSRTEELDNLTHILRFKNPQCTHGW